jgi:MFS transporter, DHA1 family, multidrug resistance protein
MSQIVSRSAAAAPAKPTWRLVLLLGSMIATGALSIDMYLPSLPTIARDLHGAPGSAEPSVSAFFIGLSIGQLIYGPLSDRVGRRGPLLAGLCLYVAASLACAAAPSLPVLIAARFVQALGACSAMVIARAVVRDRFNHKEVVHVLSQLMLVMGVAPTLAPLAGGYLVAVSSWRALFVVLALFGAGLCAIVYAVLPESRSLEDRRHAQGEAVLATYLTLFRSPRFTYIANSPELAIRTFGFTPEGFAWLFGANAAGYIASAQLNRRLVGRFGSSTILTSAIVGAILPALAMALAAACHFAGVYGVFGPLFLIMASLGFTQPNAAAEALNADPRRAGAIASFTGSANFLLGASLSTLCSLFHDGSGLAMALVITASLIAALAAARIGARAKGSASA